MKRMSSSRHELGIVGIYIGGLLFFGLALAIIQQREFFDNLEASQRITFQTVANLCYFLFLAVVLLIWSRTYLIQNQWTYVRHSPGFVFCLTLVGIFLMFCVNWIMVAVYAVFRVSETPANEAALREIFQNSWYDRLGIFIFAVLLAPVVEELVFRKAIYNLVLRRLGVVAAILISALVFALVHEYSNVFLVAHYFALGTVLAFVYHYSGRLIFVPIFVHMFQNLFALMMQLIVFNL